MKPSDLRASLLLAALLPLGSCASTQGQWPDALPLRALVVPVAQPEIRSVSQGEQAGKPTPLRLVFDSAGVTQAVASAMEQRGFVSVVTLDWEGAAPEQTYDSLARRRFVLEQAVAARADVVVELDLRYDPELFRRNSETFWLNFVLFLFAGPSNWFIGDQVYLADVQLTARILDRHALEATELNLADTSSLLMTVSAQFDRLSLRFVDRAEDLGDYLTGVLVPSGFLARHTGKIAAGLQVEVPKRVAEQLVKNLLDRGDELTLRTLAAPMFIDPARLVVVREGADIVVRGEVELLDDGRGSSVRQVLVQAGEQAVWIRAAAGSTGRFPIETRLPAGDGVTLVRIECEAGARERFVRSYTFQVPAAR